MSDMASSKQNPGGRPPIPDCLWNDVLDMLRHDYTPNEIKIRVGLSVSKIYQIKNDGRKRPLETPK